MYKRQVLLGLVLGPHLLGAVDRPTLSALEPLALVALAWLALLTGVDLSLIHISEPTRPY